MTRERTGNDLPTIIDELIEKRINSYKHTFIARIIAFYPLTQRADVQPLLNKKNSNGEYVESAILLGCPVAQQKSTGFSVNVPYLVGDTVLCATNRDSLQDLIVDGAPKISRYDNLRKHDLTSTIIIGSVANLSEVALVSEPESDGYLIYGRESGSIISMKPNGDITVSRGSQFISVVDGVITVEAPLIKLNGDVEVSGSITTPSAIVNGKELAEHVHNGVQSGSSNSGPNQ